MADDDLLFRQFVDLLRGPRRLVVDQPGEFELPCRAVDRLDVFDFVEGIEARRLDHLIFAEGRRQMVRPNSSACTPSLNDDTARRNACTAPVSLTLQPVSMVSAPRRNRAAQQIAAVDVGDQLPVVVQRRFGRCRSSAGRSRMRGSGRHGVGPIIRRERGWASSASTSRAAGDHGADGLGHQQRQRDVDDQEADDRRHADEMRQPCALEAAEQRRQF